MDFNAFYQSKKFDSVLSAFAVTVLLMTSLHFWPFSSSKLWQYTVPFNSIPLIFGGVILCLNFLIPDKFKIRIPESLLFFVIICILSLTITPDIKRSLFYTVKIFGALIGFYVLLLGILKKIGNYRFIAIAIIAGCFISVICCVFCRISFSDDVFGFHQNAYKYSTYAGIFGGFSVSYLILNVKLLFQLLGYVLVILLILSAGTIGLIISMITATSAMVLISFCLFRGKSRKTVCIKYLICVALCLTSLSFKSEKHFPVYDARLDDGQLAPLKQRYIEWQAEINILKDRIITGCGAGAINTYRSEYYGRLPKFNSLKAFDQNGYLATAAELGLLGLFGLVWMLSDHFKKIFTALSKTDSMNQALLISCLCSLIAAAVANLFSSFFYNGILISLVAIFVLIDYTTMPDESEQI